MWGGPQCSACDLLFNGSRLGFLNHEFLDEDSIICCEELNIVGCLAASLSSTHLVPVVHTPHPMQQLDMSADMTCSLKGKIAPT